ncbi:hypothetical protein V8C35DRAFT_326755 [Trichoderma chlorosporum]
MADNDISLDSNLYSLTINLFIVSADLETEDFNGGSDTTSSTTDSETVSSLGDISFDFDETDIEPPPPLRDEPFPPAIPGDFLDLLEDCDDGSDRMVQSLDLMEEFGIVVILPSAFSKPGLDIKPYHTTRSLDEEYGLFVPFTPDRMISWGVTETALVIEIRDADRFMASIGANGRYVGARHMFEDLYEQLYSSNEEE